MLIIAATLSMMIRVEQPIIQTGCDSNTNVARNCFDEFKNAAKNTFRTESEPERAQNVGEAVRNCWNCATETMSNQMHEFSNQNSEGN